MKKTAVFLALVILIISMASCSEDAYKKGTLTSTTYESEYLNLKFAVPEGVKLATEEELNKASNTGTQLLQAESLSVDSSTSVYEMQAVYENGYPNVILMTEKLSSKSITADNYINTLKEQLAKLSTIKYEVTTGNGKATIAGQEYTTLSATATYGTVSFSQTYYIRVQKGRAISFICTYTNDTVDKKDTILAAFKEYYE